MSDLTVNIPAGESRRLMTAGKYCDRNITVIGGAGGMETVTASVTLWGDGITMIRMTPFGVQSIENPDGDYEVVKDSPICFIYDSEGGTSIACSGSGFEYHYNRSWPYDGHSCHVLSFYEDGNIILEEK